jgi:hypothetical protein
VFKFNYCVAAEFDQFPSFDFEDFENSSSSATNTTAAAVAATTKVATTSSNARETLAAAGTVSGSKRGRDEQVINTACNNTSETEVKQQKFDEIIKEQRLKAITDLIHSLNQCEHESIERLLREEYDDDVVVKINHLRNDAYYGRNALLLIWVATHEAYPDGMYKVLEKRYVNMTVPRGKTGIPSNASPKVEFVYKFSGTKIMPGNLNTLIRQFSDKHEDYGTYGPEKLNDKLLQFVATSDMTFESESSQNFIGEATLTFVPETSRVKEVNFNILAFDGSSR